jgi:hypothetical protein
MGGSEPKEGNAEICSQYFRTEAINRGMHVLDAEVNSDVISTIEKAEHYANEHFSRQLETTDGHMTQKFKVGHGFNPWDGTLDSVRAPDDYGKGYLSTFVLEKTYLKGNGTPPERCRVVLAEVTNKSNGGIREYGVCISFAPEDGNGGSGEGASKKFCLSEPVEEKGIQKLIRFLTSKIDEIEEPIA